VDLAGQDCFLKAPNRRDVRDSTYVATRRERCSLATVADLDWCRIVGARTGGCPMRSSPGRSRRRVRTQRIAWPVRSSRSERAISYVSRTVHQLLATLGVRRSAEGGHLLRPRRRRGALCDAGRARARRRPAPSWPQARSEQPPLPGSERSVRAGAALRTRRCATARLRASLRSGPHGGRVLQTVTHMGEGPQELSELARDGEEHGHREPQGR